MPRNIHCQNCDLYKTTYQVCVWSSGPQNQHVDIMLVGEAPGADEERMNKPFVGAAGKILDNALRQAGISRDDVYITNVAKCRPPGNRKPTKDEMSACMSYLVEQIDEIEPRVIVPLGNTALEALTGLKAITKARGHRTKLSASVQARRTGIPTEIDVLPTLHPSGAQYQNRDAVIANIVSDLKAAKDLLTNDKQENKERHLFADSSDYVAIEPVLQRLLKAKYLTCDLEWTASTEKRADTGKTAMIWPWTGTGEVYSVSFTGRVDGQLVSVGLAYPPSSEVRSLLLEVCKKPLVFHNAMADSLWMIHERLKPNVSGDTMLLSYLHDESQPHNLEAVALRYSSAVQGGWKGGIRHSRPATEAEWLALLEYNASDTEATLLAFEGIIAELRRDGDLERIMRLHNKHLIPTLKLLARAAYVGVPFDEESLATGLYDAQERQTEALLELAEAASITPRQAAKLAGSGDQIKAYVKGQFGISMDDARKETVAELIKYPAIAAIQRYRKEQKLISTYLDPWTTMLERQQDGRIHSIYRLGKTNTGRLSSESEIGGALQVTPREGWVRALVKAKPGRAILASDYSTVEMRITAWMANDENMIRMFREGADMHKFTAGFLICLRTQPDMTAAEYVQNWQEYTKVVTKEDRQGAKGVNFGLAFGMREQKLVTYSKNTYKTVITLQQAEVARTGYFKLFPAIPPWHDASMAEARRKGWRETPFGRRRSFTEQDMLSAINFPVQSTASDLTLQAMIQTDARFREAKLDAIIIGFVHDSVLVDVAERHADEAARILQYSMENVDTSAFGFRVPVPLPVEVKLGDTWAG